MFNLCWDRFVIAKAIGSYAWYLRLTVLFYLFLSVSNVPSSFPRWLKSCSSFRLCKNHSLSPKHYLTNFRHFKHICSHFCLFQRLGELFVILIFMSLWSSSQQVLNSCLMKDQMNYMKKQFWNTINFMRYFQFKVVSYFGLLLGCFLFFLTDPSSNLAFYLQPNLVSHL